MIQLGVFEFISPYWNNISESAKDLIRRLIVVDSKRRYTATQVLYHRWITGFFGEDRKVDNRPA